MYKMESYCLKCKKHTKNIDPKILGTSNGKVMILSNRKYVVGKNHELLKLGSKRTFK